MALLRCSLILFFFRGCGSVSGTPPLFSCKSISVKQGDGTWQANPPFSGNGPSGQALPHCGTCSSLRGAFDVLPVAELLVVDARTSAACPKQLSTKSTSQEENDSFVYRSRLSLTRVLDGTQFTPGGSQNFGSLNFREPMGWLVSRSYPMSFGG